MSVAQLDGPGLSSTQLAAVELVARGRTTQETADALGVPLQTIAEWRVRDSLFRAALVAKRGPGPVENAPSRPAATGQPAAGPGTATQDDAHGKGVLGGPMPPRGGSKRKSRGAFISTSAEAKQAREASPCEVSGAPLFREERRQHFRQGHRPSAAQQAIPDGARPTGSRFPKAQCPECRCTIPRQLLEEHRIGHFSRCSGCSRVLDRDIGQLAMELNDSGNDVDVRCDECRPGSEARIVQGGLPGLGKRR